MLDWPWSGPGQVWPTFPGPLRSTQVWEIQVEITLGGADFLLLSGVFHWFTAIKRSDNVYIMICTHQYPPGPAGPGLGQAKSTDLNLILSPDLVPTHVRKVLVHATPSWHWAPIWLCLCGWGWHKTWLFLDDGCPHPPLLFPFTFEDKHPMCISQVGTMSWWSNWYEYADLERSNRGQVFIWIPSFEQFIWSLTLVQGLFHLDCFDMFCINKYADERYTFKV